MATDTLGNAATSSVVNISVTNLPPVPFAVSLWYPASGQVFLAPATIGVYAKVTDSNAVKTVQYFSGTNSIGIVTNTGGVSTANSATGNPFYMSWSNVPAGNYTLTAVATDSASLTTTSAPVNITVTNPPPVPFAISLWYPTNRQTFLAPATIGVHAQGDRLKRRQDSAVFLRHDQHRHRDQYGGVLLANTGTGNPFYMAWSNVPAGNYTLTAVATDSAGLTRHVRAGQHQCHQSAAGAVCRQFLVSDQRPDIPGPGEHRGSRYGDRLERRRDGAVSSPAQPHRHCDQYQGRVVDQPRHRQSVLHVVEQCAGGQLRFDGCGDGQRQSHRHVRAGQHQRHQPAAGAVCR